MGTKGSYELKAHITKLQSWIIIFFLQRTQFCCQPWLPLHTTGVKASGRLTLGQLHCLMCGVSYWPAVHQAHDSNSTGGLCLPISLGAGSSLSLGPPRSGYIILHTLHYHPPY